MERKYRFTLKIGLSPNPVGSRVEQLMNFISYAHGHLFQGFKLTLKYEFSWGGLNEYVLCIVGFTLAGLYFNMKDIWYEEKI